jgi:hypothetical protein
MVVSHLEYAMNFTREIYPQPFVPHHLGIETSWNLLIFALMHRRRGGHVSHMEWIAPYWPVIERRSRACWSGIQHATAGQRKRLRT